MQLAIHYGQDSVDRLNRSGLLFADGKRLAISNGYFSYLCHGFCVKELCMTTDISGGMYVDIHLRSFGRVDQVSGDQLHQLFQSAANMSIDDLLKLINLKMDERSEADTNGHSPILQQPNQ